MRFIERVQTLQNSLKTIPSILDQVDQLTSLESKINGLLPLLRSLSDTDGKIASLEKLNQTVGKIEDLDKALEQLKQVGSKPPQKEEPKKNPEPDDHTWNRLQILAKFSQLAGKAREIELEWQKIQQDENDAFFKNQVQRGNDEGLYMYKKGFAEGVRWCIERFG